MHKIMGFADGENLVLRYQAMCEAGFKPKKNVIHIPNQVVWHPEITMAVFMNIIRISYYQVVVGDDDYVSQTKEYISNIRYNYETDVEEDTSWSGCLVPRVFKKGKGAKTKSVDINLTVDVLRQAANGNVDVLLLLSGDGDYLPLVEEASRSGKQVWVAAFSSGFNVNLKYAADEYFCLDDYFFTKKPPVHPVVAKPAKAKSVKSKGSQ